MSNAATNPRDGHDHAEHHTSDYVRVWVWLLILLAISVVGPMFEIPALTLVTAFGIAIVKAYLVARNFMHINIEPKYVVYLLTTMLMFMFLFVAGVSPDVLRHDGRNWNNESAKAEVERVLEAEAAGGHGHGAHH